MNFRRATDPTRGFLRDLTLRFGLSVGVACGCVLSPVAPAAEPAATPNATAPIQPKTFKSPEKAAEALILAAEQFDRTALREILGPDGAEAVITEDSVQSKNECAAFAAEARVKTRIVREPKNSKVATLYVGQDEWPTPFPIVQKDGKWRFDPEVGLQEIANRRIGRNELDAIEVCRGYVEAQYEYAAEKRDGAIVNQYAQRVVSTIGRQDGLAWQDPDGTWRGPVGEEIARVIAEGYRDRQAPYHGYYFKVLKGQGPDAPFGEMDFLVKGVMIGGFALVASPADYAVTGVKTFIVSHDGIVYEKDLGPTTVAEFRAMERYNPDPSWSVVEAP